jgi:hypothetical protein
MQSVAVLSVMATFFIGKPLLPSLIFVVTVISKTKKCSTARKQKLGGSTVFRKKLERFISTTKIINVSKTNWLCLGLGTAISTITTTYLIATLSPNDFQQRHQVFLC